MEKHAYIFTECGAEIGYGHLVRCIALYDELAATGLQVRFVLNAEVKSVSQVINGRNYIQGNWYDESWRAAKANLDNDIYAIVDSYVAGIDTYKQISKGVKRNNGISKVIYIDDFNRLDYPSGIIVNPSIFGEALSYNRRNGQIYLLGPQYIILRKEFYNLPTDVGIQRAKKAGNVENILIIMGGSDIKNLTPKIMESLDDSDEYKTCIKHVVIGKGFNNIDEIKAKAKSAKLYYNLNAGELRDLMLYCDVAISAAGQTAHELIATKLPFVCIKVVDNQEYNVRGLLKNRIIDKYFDFENKSDLQLEEGLKEIPAMLGSLRNNLDSLNMIDIKYGVRNIVKELMI